MTTYQVSFHVVGIISAAHLFLELQSVSNSSDDVEDGSVLAERLMSQSLILFY
jgi:hypothetical protein